MITKDKVDIHQKYKGDIDMWARAGSKREKAIMSDDDWGVIESVIQDIKLVKSNLSSQSYSNNLQNKLKEICDSESTIQLINNLAAGTDQPNDDNFIKKIFKVFKRK